MSTASQSASSFAAGATVPAPCAYGVLLLPELLNGSVTKEEIVLPLTLAYVFAQHFEFRLPLVPAALAAVESAFDEIIRSMPIVNKGVLYVRMREFSPAALEGLLRASTLVIRSDGKLDVCAPATAAEIVLLSAMAQGRNAMGDGTGPRMLARNLEALRDPELRKKIADCISIFELQSGGHITQGDFSVSW